MGKNLILAIALILGIGCSNSDSDLPSTQEQQQRYLDQQQQILEEQIVRRENCEKLIVYAEQQCSSCRAIQMSMNSFGHEYSCEIPCNKVTTILTSCLAKVSYHHQQF